MARELTSHKVNGLNESIQILVVDEPGAGGANHQYELWIPDTIVDGPEDGHQHGAITTVKFQNGPILENGVNGISNESLLAIVQDRLESFQKGPYACRENAIALTKLQECLMWLQYRTRERIQRGVEGTSSK